MAAGLLILVAAEEKVNLEVDSAGLAHHANESVASNAVRVMKELGVDISDEYSKPVTAKALDWAEIVLAVEHRHAAYLVEEYPLLKPKIRWLDKTVRDPYGGPVTIYREVRNELRDLLSSFVGSFTVG